MATWDGEPHGTVLREAGSADGCQGAATPRVELSRPRSSHGEEIVQSRNKNLCMYAHTETPYQLQQLLPIEMGWQ